MNYTLVTGPSVEPISLNAAKLFLRIDQDVEDTLVTSLIVAARQYIEDKTWRPMCTQTWKLSLNESEVTEFIGVSKAPVQSITSVIYTDPYGNSQTITTGTDMVYDLLNEPAVIRLINIPQILDTFNALQITFVCGYGVAASVPDALKLAMYMLIGHWYEHRESVAPGTMNEVPMSVEALIQPYKNTWFYPYN